MTKSEAIANLKRIKDMTWGLKESCMITKEHLNFCPDLSEAIGHFARAELSLERAISKINKVAQKVRQTKN